MAHFGQTRSGTRNTHASGQDLPLIRALQIALVCCPQARLRTFPGNDILGTRGGEFCWIKIGGKKCRVQVTLHGTNPTNTVVPALGERLLLICLTTMTVLRELGGMRGEFV